MTTDRLFVIMLVMLIPMTGCFGAIDNADAEDNTGETTIVNNYYNNTTVIPDEVEYFTVGGMFDNDFGNHSSGYNYPYQFNTIAGEFVEIHYFQNENSNSISIETNCDDESTDYYSQYGNEEYPYLWGSYTSCEHSVRVNVGNSDSYGFSLVYSIKSATVV